MGGAGVLGGADAVARGGADVDGAGGSEAEAEMTAGVAGGADEGGGAPGDEAAGAIAAGACDASCRRAIVKMPPPRSTTLATPRPTRTPREARGLLDDLTATPSPVPRVEGNRGGGSLAAVSPSCIEIDREPEPGA